MPNVCNVTRFHGPPHRIWSALTEPGQRTAWQPDIILKDPRVDRTHCALFLARWLRPVRLTARIYEREWGEKLSWICGMPLLLSLEERFELLGDDGGTRLIHRLYVRGLLAWIIPLFPYGHLKRSIAQADRRLAQYLSWRATRFSAWPCPTHGLHPSLGELQ
jgi:hypothetical protein